MNKPDLKIILPIDLLNSLDFYGEPYWLYVQAVLECYCNTEAVKELKAAYDKAEAVFLTEDNFAWEDEMNNYRSRLAELWPRKDRVDSLTPEQNQVFNTDLKS